MVVVDRHWYGCIENRNGGISPVFDKSIKYDGCDNHIKMLFDRMAWDDGGWESYDIDGVNLAKAISYSCGSAPAYPYIRYKSGVLSAQTASGVSLAEIVIDDDNWCQSVARVIRRYNEVINLLNDSTNYRYDWVISIPAKDKNYQIEVFAGLMEGHNQYRDLKTGIVKMVDQGVRVVNPGKCGCGSDKLVIHNIYGFDMLEFECDSCLASNVIHVADFEQSIKGIKSIRNGIMVETLI